MNNSITWASDIIWTKTQAWFKSVDKVRWGTKHIGWHMMMTITAFSKRGGLISTTTHLRVKDLTRVSKFVQSSSMSSLNVGPCVLYVQVCGARSGIHRCEVFCL